MTQALVDNIRNTLVPALDHSRPFAPPAPELQHDCRRLPAALATGPSDGSACPGMPHCGALNHQHGGAGGAEQNARSAGAPPPAKAASEATERAADVHKSPFAPGALQASSTGPGLSGAAAAQRAHGERGDDAPGTPKHSSLLIQDDGGAIVVSSLSPSPAAPPPPPYAAAQPSGGTGEGGAAGKTRPWEAHPPPDAAPHQLPKLSGAPANLAAILAIIRRGGEANSASGPPAATPACGLGAPASAPADCLGATPAPQVAPASPNDASGLPTSTPALPSPGGVNLGSAPLAASPFSPGNDAAPSDGAAATPDRPSSEPSSGYTILTHGPALRDFNDELARNIATVLAAGPPPPAAVPFPAPLAPYVPPSEPLDRGGQHDAVIGAVRLVDCAPGNAASVTPEAQTRVFAHLEGLPDRSAVAVNVQDGLRPLKRGRAVSMRAVGMSQRSLGGGRSSAAIPVITADLRHPHRPRPRSSSIERLLDGEHDRWGPVAGGPLASVFKAPPLSAPAAGAPPPPAPRAGSPPPRAAPLERRVTGPSEDVTRGKSVSGELTDAGAVSQPDMPRHGSVHHWPSSSEDEAERSPRPNQPVALRAGTWRESEHAAFLKGLAACGPGRWTQIARGYVMSRTAAQVASHAQKYFIRHNIDPSKPFQPGKALPKKSGPVKVRRHADRSPSPPPAPLERAEPSSTQVTTRSRQGEKRRSPASSFEQQGPSASQRSNGSVSAFWHGGSVAAPVPVQTGGPASFKDAPSKLANESFHQLAQQPSAPVFPAQIVQTGPPRAAPRLPQLPAHSAGPSGPPLTTSEQWGVLARDTITALSRANPAALSPSHPQHYLVQHLMAAAAAAPPLNRGVAHEAPPQPAPPPPAPSSGDVNWCASLLVSMKQAVEASKDAPRAPPAAPPAAPSAAPPAPSPPQPHLPLSSQTHNFTNWWSPLQQAQQQAQQQPQQQPQQYAPPQQQEGHRAVVPGSAMPTTADLLAALSRQIKREY